MLIIDYGHLGDKEDTLRGFKNHELIDPLSHPGDADITADVNFDHLRIDVITRKINVLPLKLNTKISAEVYIIFSYLFGLKRLKMSFECNFHQ